MLKVQILDRCPYCNGEAMTFVGKAIDTNGKPYDRYSPCCMCDGSGENPKWISLQEFAEMLRQALCPHEHTSFRGSMHFSAGDVWDDIEEVCNDCGANLDRQTLGDFIQE